MMQVNQQKYFLKDKEHDNVIGMWVYTKALLQNHTTTKKIPWTLTVLAR